MKLSDIGKLKPDWEKELRLILQIALRKKMFKYQVSRVFSKACLSDTDIYEALHFVRFIMKVQPGKIPTTSRVKMHSFSKTALNPFLKELNVN